MKTLHLLLSALLLITTVLTPLQPVSAAPAGDPLLTVGTIIGGAFLAKSLVGDLIDQASGETRELLAEVEKMLNELINQLGATYADLLDVTLDQLDQFARDQLLRLHSLVQRLQSDLQVGLDNLNETILEDLRFITLQVRTTLAQMEEVVAVAIGGVLIVVDQAAFNLSFIVVLVILGVGLLAFVWLIFTRKLPQESSSRRLALIGMGAFLVLFVALLLPQGRAYALTWSGLARRAERLLEAHIFQVVPETLVLGRTQEMVLLGARLAPDGQPPQVEIGGRQMQVTAAANEIVAVAVDPAPLAGLSGTQTVSLQTLDPQSGEAQVATAAINIREMAPLPSVISWRIVPVGKVYEQGGELTVTSVGCRSSAGTRTTTGSCRNEREIRLNPAGGYVLDPTVPAELGAPPGSNNPLSNPGDAVYGFRETITTYKQRDPRRTISFLQEGTRIVGIIVTASARSDTRHPITGNPRNRGEFWADYTIFGRRVLDDVQGRVWTFNGSCPISGTVVCGSYPYPGDLTQFFEGHRFTVQVSLRGSDGEVVARSGSLVPNDPTSVISAPLRYEGHDGRQASATYELRMENHTLTAFGPDLGVTLPPLLFKRINEGLLELRGCVLLGCP